MSAIATRRERVVLDLEDDLTPGLLRAAAAAELLNNRVDALSKGAVRSRGANREMASGVDEVERSASRAEKSLDKYTGRLGLLADAAITLGPALVPIGAVGIPAVAGLASSFGFAAVGAGTAVAAFQGVGDALKAMNKANLEPTTQNLQAAQQAMDDISPSAQGFVKQIETMIPRLKELRDTAANGMFPGLTEGLKSLETVFPKVQRIMGAVGGELGSIGADAGASLASPRWASFFTFLENEAPKALHDMATAVGNVAHAAAQMWMAFAPLNHDFSAWMVKATGDLDKWATGLSKTQGFQEFIDYVQKTGPEVGAALGAIANAFVQIIEAAAPIGGPVLQAITAFANVVAKIANSDLGTPIMAAVIAMRLFARASALAKTSTETAFGSRAKASITGFGSAIIGVTKAEERASRSVAESNRLQRERVATIAKGAGTLALLGVASTGVADKFGAANTATLALAGSFIGPWGAAAGAAAGAALDVAHAGDGLKDSLTRLSAVAGKVDFATFNKQMKDAQKKIDDLKHSTGVGDFLSDSAKLASGVFHGRGFTDNAVIKSYQKDANAAEAEQDNALRTRGAARANAAMAASNQLAARGFQLTAAAAQEAAGGLTAFTAAATRANNAISRQGAFDAYRSSLLDFQDALKQNGKTLDANTRAGLGNRAALRNMASDALKAAEGIKNIGDRSVYLQKARRSFIQAAESAGATRAQAKRLADQFGLIGRINAKPKITAQDHASPTISHVRSELDALNGKTVQTFIRSITTHQNVTKPATTLGGMFPIPKKKAEGGRIAGPGGPRDDVIPAWLSNGEFVVNAAATARNLDLLHQINAQRFAVGGRVQRFADGGEARRRNNDHPHRHHGQQDETHKHVNHFAAALKEATKSLNKEKAARDALISKRNDLKTSVRDQFLSDPFAGGNVWAPGGGNPVGILKADTAKANAFKSTLYHLKKAGLDGQALAAIASTGDLGQARALLAGGKAGVGQFESAFNRRAAAANAVGAYAGNAVYGSAIARDNTQLVHLNATVRRLEAEIRHQHKENKKDRPKHAKDIGDHVAKGVNHAASKAKRRNR